MNNDLSTTRTTAVLLLFSLALLFNACKHGATEPLGLPDPLWQATDGPPFGSGVADFVFGPNGHYYAHLGLKMARSVDDGRSWTPVAYPTAFKRLTIDTSGKLYGLVNTGVYISTDEGNSWAFHGEGIPTYAAQDDLAVIGNDWLLTSSSVDHGALAFESTDGGVTWRQVNFGGDELLYDRPRGALYTKGYAFHHNRLSKSTDNGNTWTTLYDQYGYQSFLMTVDSTGGVWIVDPEGYVLAGPPFQPRGQLGTYTHVITVQDPSLVMAGGPGTTGFQLSRDGGKTWTTNNSGMTDSTVTAIGICPGGTVLVGTQSGMIYRSKAPITK